MDGYPLRGAAHSNNSYSMQLGTVTHYSKTLTANIAHPPCSYIYEASIKPHSQFVIKTPTYVTLISYDIIHRVNTPNCRKTMTSFKCQFVGAFLLY